MIGAVQSELSWEDVEHLPSEVSDYPYALGQLHHASIEKYLSQLRCVFLDALGVDGKTHLIHDVQMCIKFGQELTRCS